MHPLNDPANSIFSHHEHVMQQDAIDIQSLNNHEIDTKCSDKHIKTNYSAQVVQLIMIATLSTHFNPDGREEIRSSLTIEGSTFT